MNAALSPAIAVLSSRIPRLDLLPVFSAGTDLVSSGPPPMPPPDGETPDTTLSVHLMRELGIEPAEIAERLNGTRHTAEIKDARLAQAVVETACTEIEARKDPAGCRNAFLRLSAALRGHLEAESQLTMEHLISWLHIVDPQRAEAVAIGIFEKRLSVEVVPGSRFDAIIGHWGEAPSCTISFYSGRGEIPRILIRDLPPSAGDGRRLIDRRVQRSPLGLVHESQHWIDFAGPDPIRLPRFFGRRKARYVTEIRAYLAEHRARVRLGNFQMTEKAREQGLTLAEALKEQVYRDYYAWRFFDRLRDRIADRSRLSP